MKARTTKILAGVALLVAFLGLLLELAGKRQAKAIWNRSVLDLHAYDLARKVSMVGVLLLVIGGGTLLLSIVGWVLQRTSRSPR